MVKLLLIIPVMASLFLIGCVTLEPDTEQEQQEFQQRMEDQLAEVDAEIDRLTDQAQDLSGEARAEFDKQIAQLEDERAAIQDKLNQIPEVTEDEWQNFTAEVEQAADDLQQAASDLADSFSFSYSF